MEHRKLLRDMIQQLDDPGSPLPIISLEQFFEGNEFLESIVDESNTTYRPQILYSIFKRLREIDGIHDIYVEVKEIGHPEKWPIADTFWVVATADPRHFRNQWPTDFWDENLPCDYLTYPRLDDRITERIEIPVGMVARGMQYFIMPQTTGENDG